MPPSQLKTLKAALQEKGVVGHQKSKKQQRQASRNGVDKNDRSQTKAALQSIREKFNPFEAKPASRAKHEFSSSSRNAGYNSASIVARPGITKGLGEEHRRKTLLLEMRRRKKVGGLLDRRFGESDVAMTPEEKALHRFVAEKQRVSRKQAIFDLGDDEDGNLTHLGQALPLDSLSKADDFQEPDLKILEDSPGNLDYYSESRKRRRLSDSDMSQAQNLDSTAGRILEKRKTKNEVMEEVISKSKLYKYGRQQAKEDDDDLRAKLDNELTNLYPLIRESHSLSSKTNDLMSVQREWGSISQDRKAILTGLDRSSADQEYDKRLHQLALDQRAKPTAATLTDSEKAADQAQRLQKLEQSRLERMKGPSNNGESEELKDTADPLAMDAQMDLDQAEIAALNLGSGLDSEVMHRELGVEDEDEFVLDDDLVDIDLDEKLLSSENDDSSSHGISQNNASDNDDDANFVRGLSFEEDVGRDVRPDAKLMLGGSRSNLAFKYPCPQTHDEFLDLLQNATLDELPIIVQRIRALHEPQLASENKGKLGKFATVLVDHISYIANTSIHSPFVACEALIRHIHSLAKMFPEEIGSAFRDRVRSICQSRPTNPNAGDLVTFTAIASIFPTSDHFHQVVTPTLLYMTQYLGQKMPLTLKDLIIGAYIVTLCLDFQKLSHRYVPEVVDYVVNTIISLLPAKPRRMPEFSPLWIQSENFQMKAMLNEEHGGELHINFWKTLSCVHLYSADEEQKLKYSLLGTHLSLVTAMVRLWADKFAFCEIFDPIYSTLQFVTGQISQGVIAKGVRVQAQKAVESTLESMTTAQQARRPLRLHNHRPLAIKTSMPKFEESFDPDKHYDPDRGRAELSKLKAEHRKERKGALRDLRKDANFLARESLREKREKDFAYEKKFKRLVAEIQGEEGREAKLYESEKKDRKGKR